MPTEKNPLRKSEWIFYALNKLISRILFNIPPYGGKNNHLSAPDITAGIKQPTKFGLALR